MNDLGTGSLVLSAFVCCRQLLDVVCGSVVTGVTRCFLLTSRIHGLQWGLRRSELTDSSLPTPTPWQTHPLLANPQTMLNLTTPTICMSLVVVALAVTSELYRREVGSYPDTPDKTVPAPSRIVCSMKCTSQQEWRCGGFQYLANGTCLLYQEGTETTCLSTPETPPTEENTASAQSALYRRPPQPACPGLWLF